MRFNRFHQTLIILLMTALVLPCQVYAATKKPKQITIGFIPSEPDKQLEKNALILAKHIQDSLKINTNIYIPKDYQGLIDAMSKKKVDFAFFTAMSFVFAEKQAGAKILLKKVWNKKPFYHSVILAKKASGIKALKDLKGKTFAFVDQRSTSGFLYPSVLFKQKNWAVDSFFKSFIFTGTHKDSVEKVLKGEVDAAAVFADDSKGIKNAAVNYFPARKKEFQVLWVSDPIPNDPFVVRKDFYNKYPHVTHDVMFTILDLKNHAKGNILKKVLNVTEMEFATSRQYDPVRKMVETMKLKLEK